MLKFYNFDFKQVASSSFNWLSFFAIIISSLSIFSTFLFIYTTKRTELRKNKFEKLCINPLDKAFESLDTIFDNSAYVSVYKQNITDGFLDIQILSLTLQNVYKNIPLQKIINIIENFTDTIYGEYSSTKMNEIKTEYLSAKILIYNEFFLFAVNKEMVLFKNKKKKI